MGAAGIPASVACAGLAPQAAGGALRSLTGSRGVLVLGLGASGLSVVRYLAARGVPFTVADSRMEPPALAALRAELPGVRPRLGTFEARELAAAGLIVLSPGLSPGEPALRCARAAGVPVVGDIELFAREARAPVLAVTGSNGKSTVASLLGAMAVKAGRRALAGGNLGPPALDLLACGPVDLYVLELSSFQLETTSSLTAAVACVLNVSADHLDRYANLDAYAAAKARIYAGGGVMVVNRDDPRVAAMATAGRRVISFGLCAASEGDYGLVEHEGQVWLARGAEPLLSVAAMRLRGRHNAANALAALAMGEAAGLPLGAMLATLREFAGLPHRCQLLCEHEGVRWYDDSKGTNVGASAAAIGGLGGERDVVLIAGGLAKGQDFAPLRAVAAGRLRALVLIGRDAALLGRALHGVAPTEKVHDMREAVHVARRLAQPGDVVLLSPACASMDMFRDYEQRGDVFAAAVREELG